MKSMNNSIWKLVERTKSSVFAYISLSEVLNYIKMICVCMRTSWLRLNNAAMQCKLSLNDKLYRRVLYRGVSVDE